MLAVSRSDGRGQSHRRKKKMRSLGIRVVRRRLTPPLPRAHFRVALDDEELGVLSISPMHWVGEGAMEPEPRQQVTLRRAAGQDRTFYTWYRTVASGKDDVRTLTVVQLDRPDGVAINIWQLEKCEPIRWTGPSFDALSDDFAVEEIEIRYASIAWRSSV